MTKLSFLGWPERKRKRLEVMLSLMRAVVALALLRKALVATSLSRTRRHLSARCFRSSSKPSGRGACSCSAMRSERTVVLSGSVMTQLPRATLAKIWKVLVKHCKPVNPVICWMQAMDVVRKEPSALSYSFTRVLWQHILACQHMFPFKTCRSRSYFPMIKASGKRSLA